MQLENDDYEKGEILTRGDGTAELIMKKVSTNKLLRYNLSERIFFYNFFILG